ncbi:hypothetical protein K438DRAFT_1970591 [Mycena galopus ATCC 62051]|nr:hypothetical protein K438DRAFT_1970591 [Mycena galopus ATCC 62051]
MALMAWLSALALSLLCGLVFSVPVPDDDPTLFAPPILGADVDNTDSPLTPVLGPTFFFDPEQTIELPSPSSPALDPLATPEDPGFVYYFPLPSSDVPQSAASISFVVTTDTVTDTLTEPPTTTTIIIVPTNPSTTTEIVTVIVPASSQPQPSSTLASTAQSLSPTTPTPDAVWAAPTHMTNLSAFTAFNSPAQTKNLEFVTGIPASATTGTRPDPWFPAFLDPIPTGDSTASDSDSNSDSESYMPWDNTSTVLQVRYPKDSANPGATPIGGGQFYATPLDLTHARMVTLTYSVFFPFHFEWVKGGKLPGLYGGRPGCSGGDAATDCFSTRLMWREKGAGELYLYAPKDKQTQALCADPQSDCNAAYGFSVGRGSFPWLAGGWTTVTQVVELNTPGEQDGKFALYVDGQRKIWREDIYYRGPGPNTTSSKSKSAFASALSTSAATNTPDGDANGGQLGLGLLTPLLTPLLTGLLGARTMEPLSESTPASPPQQPPVDDIVLANDAPHEWAVQLAPTQTDLLGATPLRLAETTTTSTVTTTVTVYPTLLPVSDQAAAQGPVPFVGIFFSTFFGGHGEQYDTPEDQYTWFKDFSLSGVFDK